MAQIKAGIYKARAVDAQYGVTSKGNDQIVVSLKLASGEMVSSFLVFTDKTWSFQVDRLRALGCAGNLPMDLTGLDANEVDVQITYETYDGKEKMRVEIMTGGGRVQLQNQMDDAQKRAFAARVAAWSRASGGPAQNGAKPATPAPTTTKPDEEIPF